MVKISVISVGILSIMSDYNKILRPSVAKTSDFRRLASTGCCGPKGLFFGAAGRSAISLNTGPISKPAVRISHWWWFCSRRRTEVILNHISSSAPSHSLNTASISHEEWCWKHKSVEVEVLDSDVVGVEFRQIGYILRCSLSHAITLVHYVFLFFCLPCCSANPSCPWPDRRAIPPAVS